jgi:NAD+ synthase (glutamine-hydrolysing)
MKIKIGSAAINTTPIGWKWNFTAITEAMKAAQAQGVRLLCLPELCLTGYGCEDLFFRAHVRKQALQVAEKLAKDSATADLITTVGLPLEYQGVLYNVVAVLNDGVIRGFYAKQNLAGDGVHYEPRWFKPWPQAKVVDFTLPSGAVVPLGDTTFGFDLGSEKATFGFEICEDAWVAERPGIALAKAAVDLILNPSASHFSFGKTHTRERFVIDGSRAFNCVYVYANLLGNESGRIVFDGECLIAHGGELITKGRRFGYGRWRLTTAVIDLEINRFARLRSASFRSERRITCAAGKVAATNEPTTKAQPRPVIEPWHSDGYNNATPKQQEKLFELLAAETLGLFDYLRKTGTKGFVISLSGGADSTMCAILVHEMVRVGRYGHDDDKAAFKEVFPWFEIPDEVISRVSGATLSATKRILTCIYQSTVNSSEQTLKAAESTAQEIGARFENVSVQKTVDFAENFLTQYLGRPLNWKQDDSTRQNLQARARALLPWCIANAEEKLNITTSNRSEAAVGYCTMDGDTAGSIGPLGGIDKASILDALDLLLANRYAWLAQVRQRPPTAELKPAEANQTDEKDLMPYQVLDAIERASILEGKSPEDIVREGIATAEQARKFFTLFPRNQWKRERYAPSFHLDSENLDPRSYTRFPILSGGFREEMDQISS